jgi:hypothetical protein
MPFDKSSAMTFGDGYYVDFGDDDVSCRGAPPAALKMIAGWSHGQHARVTGTIDSTMWGSLFLSDCRIEQVP